MSIRSAADHVSTKDVSDATVRLAFIGNVHRLLALGYARLNAPKYHEVDENLITQDLAAALPRPCAVVVGEGAGEVAAAAERAGDGMVLLPAALGRARAFHTGLLGARLLARGEGQRSEDLVPRYVRRAEAEVRRTGERFEKPAR